MKKWNASGVQTDDTALTKAEAFVDYMASPAGQTEVTEAEVGGVNLSTVPAYVPIPDYDVNLDGAVGLADLGNIIGRWGQTSSCSG